MDDKNNKGLLNARKLMEDYASSTLSELQRQVDVSFRILNSAENRAKIPERLFQQFLPMFQGNVPREQVGEFITGWISISGSPRAEVDVLSDSGEVLFTVPPLYDTSIVNSRDDKGPSFGEIVNIFLLNKVNLGPLAMGSFTQALSDRGRQVTDGRVNDQNVDRWSSIFHRYKIPMANPRAGLPPKKEATSSDDEFDFDAM